MSAEGPVDLTLASGVLYPVLGETQRELSFEDNSDEEEEEEEESRSDSVIPANKSTLELVDFDLISWGAPSLLFRKERDEIRLSDISRLAFLVTKERFPTLCIDSLQ